MWCKHRWTIQKRWTDKETKTFCAIQKCRYCGRWKRTDISVNQDVASGLSVEHVFEERLDNQRAVVENPTMPAADPKIQP